MQHLRAHLKRVLWAALVFGNLAQPAIATTPGENSGEATPATSVALDCPSSSNCVNSLATAESLPPLRFAGSAAHGKALLLRTLAAFPEAHIVSNEAEQVVAVFTTFLGFRDQVLFRIDAAGQRIDFRSRANVGRYDFGKNRACMLEFSSRFVEESGRQTVQ